MVAAVVRLHRQVAGLLAAYPLGRGPTTTLMISRVAASIRAASACGGSSVVDQRNCLRGYARPSEDGQRNCGIDKATRPRARVFTAHATSKKRQCSSHDFISAVRLGRPQEPMEGMDDVGAPDVMPITACWPVACRRSGKQPIVLCDGRAPGCLMGRFRLGAAHEGHNESGQRERDSNHQEYDRFRHGSSP
jgi:hypothetical protein